MKVFFIGGTGIISTASTKLAAERGIELTLLTRGRRKADLPKNVRTIAADVADEAAVSQALGGQSFDAVVDWVAFARVLRQSLSGNIMRGCIVFSA
jgi:putative NADH-flavin reductase